MRKIFLSLAALCCIVTTAFAATTGDKVYFVNSQDWEHVDVQEYSSGWVKGTYGTAVSEGWQYDGHDVYSYTIQDADCGFFAVTDWTNWTSNTGGIAPVDGHFYTIDADGGYYWLTEYYYHEYYYMDNAGTVFDGTPNIVLYTSDWGVLNGSWPGEAMTSIGTFKKGESEYAAYKYVRLTPVSYGECANVNFNEGDDNWSIAVDASNKYCSWGTWYSLTDVADRIQLVGDAAIMETNWGDNANNVMWYYKGVYSVTRDNVHITEEDHIATEGYYSFRVYPGFGENNWNARFPHANAANWHESVELHPGLYSLYYTYDPATDELTCTPTACYSREVGAADKWGTMCLPNASTSYSGATFYTIAKKEGNAIVLQEVEGQLKAGYPYFFKSSDAWVSVNLDTTAYANMPGHSYGLYGSYWEYALTEHSTYDYYMLSNNELWEVEGNEAKVGAYRCFVNMAEVPTDANLAPGKRYVHMTVNGENGTTAIEDIQSDKAQSIKVIENGQLFIIKNGEKYNAQGIIVK